MFHVEQRINCPICNGQEWTRRMTCKDFTVSGESFNIASCNECGFWVTIDAPDFYTIGSYYKSDAYISHSDSKKGIMNRLYHFARKRALRWKCNLIEAREGLRVLDYGCGTGYFPEAIKKLGVDAVGVEPDSGARAECVKKGIDVFAPEEREKIDQPFDVITLWHVLEHLHNLNEDIDWLISKLKPKGKLYIAVPNRASFDAEHYKEFWAAYDVPRHLWHFTKDDISRLFENHGMLLRKTVPMKMDAFYVSMLSEQYQGGSKLNGILSGRKSNGKGKNHGFSSMVYVLERTK